MANNIDLVVASEAIKQVENLIAKLSIADSELLKVSASALLASKNISTISTPTALDKSISSTAGLTNELAKQNNVIKALENQITKLKEAKLKLNATTLQEKVDARITLQNATAEAKAVSNTASAYQRLDATHKQAVRSAQDIAVKFGANSREFKNAADKANVLDRELKKIDATLGKSQRNVGNYSSAFGGVSSALGAFGVVTGVAGIAILGKNIFDTAKELQGLDMALKQVSGSASVLGDNQVFLARISEAYGAEIKGLTQQFTQFYVSAKDKLSGSEIQNIFESITKAGASMGLSVQSQQRAFLALNQMMSKGTIQAEELRGQLGEALPGAFGIMSKAVGVNEAELAKMMKAGQLIASDVLPKFAKELEKTYGIENLTRVETLGTAQTRLANSFTKMVDSINNADSSGFGIFVKKIVAGLTNIMDFTGLLFKDESQLTEYFKRLGAAKGVDEYKDVLKNISGVTIEQQELTKKALLERERETIRVNQQIVRDEKEKRKSILGGDRALFHVQTKMEEDAIVQIGKSAAIIKAINQEKINSNKKVVVEEVELTESQIKANEDRLKSIYDLNKKELELQIANIGVKLNNEDLYYTDRLTALDQDFLKRIELSKLDYSEGLRLAKGNAEKEKIALIENQIQKLKLIEDYGKKKTSLEKQKLNPITKLAGKDLDPNKQLEDSAKKAELGLKKVGDQLEKNKISAEEAKNQMNGYLNSFISEFSSNSGFSETFKILQNDIVGFGKDFGVTFNAIAESVQEVGNFVANQSQARFDTEKQRLQDQYDISLRFAGDSSSAKEKLAEDLEKKQREIANRENKAKQRQAIFNIAIDTAQAIIAALPNIPLSIAIGALGAIQIAAVASQKIPQYKDGTENHSGGLMLVNDGSGSNFKEKVITPDGKEFTPQGRNVLLDAPKGTKVLTHEQQIHAMLNERGISMSQSVIPSGMSADEMDNILGKHFSKIQTNVTNFDRNGFSSYTEKNGNRTINNNNRVSRIGFKV